MECTTKSGQRVINLRFVPLNTYGEKVTYPIKGTIVRATKKHPRKQKEYAIWSQDGKQDVVFGTRSEDDLVNIPLELFS